MIINNAGIEKAPSPCYVIDERLLRENLKLIKSVSDNSGAEIIMALKGFAMWSVFPVVSQYVNGATASSLNEALLIKNYLGVKAHSYVPVFTPDDFEKIAMLSSHITFNSLSQYQRFYPFLKEKKYGVSVGLRVNPEFSEVKTMLYNPCAPGTRLGITADQLENGLPEGVEGLHFHALCESDSSDLVKTLNAFETRFGHLLSRLKWVNMGGGHLMTRKGYNIGLLIETIKEFKSKYQVHVILEPGSAFAWETGVLVSTVQDIVQSKGIKTAMLDVSFTAHMPDCLEMPYQPRIRNARADNNGPYVYRMGGNSCLSGDYMGDWSFDEELQVGQKVIFEDMIHYTMVKTSHFNGIKHPSIGVFDNTGNFRLVKQFGFEDYKNQLS